MELTLSNLYQIVQQTLMDSTTLRIQSRSPWQIQKAVWFSLFIRELSARFGRYHLGYFWAVAEPLALLAVLSAIKLAFGKNDIAGLPYPVFFASGILTYHIFQKSCASSLGAIESNFGLFNYQPVKPVDAIATRVFIELLINPTAALILFAVLWEFGFDFTWNSTLDTLVIVFLLAIMTLGFSLILGILSPFFHEVKKIVPIVFFRPLFFVSGIFFTADSIPEPYRSYLLLNPLLNAIELIRRSMFVGYQSHSGDVTYLGIWAFSSLFVGLCAYRLNRFALVTSGRIK